VLIFFSWVISCVCSLGSAVIFLGFFVGNECLTKSLAECCFWVCFLGLWTFNVVFLCPESNFGLCFTSWNVTRHVVFLHDMLFEPPALFYCFWLILNIRYQLLLLYLCWNSLYMCLTYWWYMLSYFQFPIKLLTLIIKLWNGCCK
jgi:hypothetical protein